MPVEIVRRDAGKKVPSRKLKKVALKVLELVEQDQAELSLAIVGNTEIRKLNAKYRKKNDPTDVLSFPSDTVLPTGRRVLGDVIISVDQAQHQAEERGRTLHEEIVTLLIHGIVHLLGYDHERSAKEARSMARLEMKIYQKLCEQNLFQV
jgi:probable rRNA maturation factor